ncbi:sirohydrochlorin ferrochelatase [Bacillus ectoiniformans]|nr:sirohydrochlorin chelatase [Bacillus ectoiniformans]MBM7649810.1 sirohydrochlorin ferrochelatase [Bacillus ectoiniformans]
MGKKRNGKCRRTAMKAVLYICHGSRVKKGREEALSFIEQTKPHIDIPIQEACFLELAEPTIEQGLAKCADQGATEIIVIPFLLLSAGHAKEDIPRELAKAHSKFPGMTIHYGKPLGVHEAIIDILIERMKEQCQPIAADASVLIVGRGSSDPETKAEFQRILQLFHSKTELTDVNVSFLAVSEPAFKEELHRLAHKKPTQLWVIPYLLFTGILMKTMKKEILTLGSETSIILCDYLGYHPLLREILTERITEASSEGGKNLVSANGESRT